MIRGREKDMAATTVITMVITAAPTRLDTQVAVPQPKGWSVPPKTIDQVELLWANLQDASFGRHGSAYPFSARHLPENGDEAWRRTIQCKGTNKNSFWQHVTSK